MTDDASFYEVCAACGAELGLEDWPPVVTSVSGDSGRELYSFCDEDCEAAWQAEE